MDSRITMVPLGVRDLEKATAFYETVIGWEKTAASNESISFFRLNGILLGLYGWELLAEDAGVSSDGTGFRGVAIAYNSRSRGEVDKVFSELGEKGATFVKDPADVFWGAIAAIFPTLTGISGK